MSLDSHSTVEQPNLETLKEKELMRSRLMINGHPVTALLDTGSQISHISEAFCHANNFQILPLDKLVVIEGTAGTLLNT